MKKILIGILGVFLFPLILVFGIVAAFFGAGNSVSGDPANAYESPSSIEGLFAGLTFPLPGQLLPPCEGFNFLNYGQCTSWACYRSSVLGHPIIQPAGNGEDVANTLIESQDWIESKIPVVGAVVSFYRGDGGHVAIVEEVLENGTWYTSDMNVNGNQRDVFKFEHKECANCTFAVWPESKDQK
ncbi:MAG: CHAP domain-containing protein [Bifidobacteriaceae bacterium]|jgi:hypothetical protein|nr:CHAP domain-containing protein [Bifidobacteriaceae bacterium]